jgi:hypothetical protein
VTLSVVDLDERRKIWHAALCECDCGHEWVGTVRTAFLAVRQRCPRCRADFAYVVMHDTTARTRADAREVASVADMSTRDER